MPNWCLNDLQISRSIDDGGVEYLYDLIQKWQDTGSEKRYGNDSLALLAERGLGIDLNVEDYPCRGSVNSLEPEDEETLRLVTETAWGPLNDIWVDLIRKYIPGSRFYYTAEESGMGIYLSNNPDYKNKYCLDSWNDSVESMFCCDKEDIYYAYEDLFKESPKKGMSVDDVIKAINETYGDQIFIHEWECDPWNGYVA